MMITIIALIISLFQLQPQDYRDDFQKVEKHFIHGKVLLDSKYHGGMYQEYPPENAIPWENTILKVVRFDGSEGAVVVDTIVSDENGRFSIELPSGKYGFISINENAKNDLYLPEGYSRYDNESSISSYWDANLPMPVSLNKKDIIGLHITNYQTSSCMKCP